jgi:hypothetical protein
MKYISRLYPVQNLNFIKNIFNSDIEINYLSINFNDLNINFKKYENFKVLLNDLNFILNSNNKKIKNLKKIKDELYEKLSDLAKNYAIESDSIDDLSLEYILKDIKNIYQYAIHIKGPFKGSNEEIFSLFKSDKMMDNYYSYKQYIIKYLMEIYFPYIRKNFPDQLEEKTKECLDPLIILIQNDVMYAFELLFDLYGYVLSNEIIDKIFVKNKVKEFVIYRYFQMIHNDLSLRGYDNDEIYDLFVNEKGKFHYSYKKILSLKYYQIPEHFSSIFMMRAPEEMEKLLFSNANSVLSYLAKMKFFINIDTDKFISYLQKYPNKIYNYLNSISYTFYNNIDIDIKKIPIKSDPILAYNYYAKIIRKWNNSNPEDDDLKLRKDLEKSVAKSPIASIKYLIKLLPSFKKEMKMKEIRKYIDDNLYEIKKSILESDDSTILLDYAKALKLRLSSDLENIIKRVPKFWNDYQKINFIK